MTPSDAQLFASLSRPHRTLVRQFMRALAARMADAAYLRECGEPERVIENYVERAKQLDAVARFKEAEEHGQLRLIP